MMLQNIVGRLHLPFTLYSSLCLKGKVDRHGRDGLYLVVWLQQVVGSMGDASHVLVVGETSSWQNRPKQHVFGGARLSPDTKHPESQLHQMVPSSTL